MEIDLEILDWGGGAYLWIRVETETEFQSAGISLKELKQALENA